MQTIPDHDLDPPYYWNSEDPDSMLIKDITEDLKNALAALCRSDWTLKEKLGRCLAKVEDVKATIEDVLE